MTSRFLKAAVLGAVAASLTLQAASAQRSLQPRAEPEPPPADSTISGVEVTAPKVVRRERYGVMESEVSMSVRVSYSDLDMNTAAGVVELDRRVAEAADYVCRQLANMYPVGGYPDQFYCEKYAVRDAEPQVVKARLTDGPMIQ